MTHVEKIYNLFKENVGKEINHRLIIDSEPRGLGISEYTGRIKDLRKRFGCTCAESTLSCLAKEHIVNTRTNYYRYESSVLKRKPIYTVFNSQPRNDLPNQIDELTVALTEAEIKNDQIKVRRIRAKLIALEGFDLQSKVQQALL